MAFIHPQSCECAKSELDLWAVPPTQTSIESGHWIDYNPVSSLAHGLPIEFAVTAGSGAEYFDMANTMLYVTAKITKADGTDLDQNEHVGPINLTLHSMFSEIDIKLNDTLITSTNNTYAYRAYIETLLSYDKASKESQLQCGLYYKDTAGRMDVAAVAGDTALNLGLKKRGELFAESKVVEMLGKIHSDLMFTDRYLPGDCTLRFRLVRNKDAFTLMSNVNGAAHKLQIQSCKLFVRKAKISPSVLVAHASAQEVSNMKFPIRRVVCKTFTITNGLMNFTQENLFSGQLPSRIIIGMVDNQAFNGAFDRNPFNFKHYDVSSLKLYADGYHGFLAPLEMDFTNNRSLLGYMSLFCGTGKMFRDEGLDIQRSEYGSGFTLYAFDLSPDLAENDHYSLNRQGNVRLDIKYRVALPQTINVICYGEFDSVIELDRNRNVLFDYAI